MEYSRMKENRFKKGKLPITLSLKEKQYLELSKIKERDGIAITGQIRIAINMYLKEFR